METKHTYERTGSKMVLIKDPTVMQQLAHASKIFQNNEQPMLIRNFFAAPELIESWECEVIPDLSKVVLSRTEITPKDAIVLDEETNPKVSELVMWVGNIVTIYAGTLDQIEGN